MDEKWLVDNVAVMRQIGSDRQTYEVKEAKGGLPKSTVETLSAFSNGAGGHIILGLSEKNGFVPVEGFDARKIADALASACDNLTPPVRPLIEILPFEGALLVCARVDEMHPRDKPCYITARNRYDGAFVRTSDGDRRLSSYEVDRLLEEHRQPTYDDEIVPDAAMDDLDGQLVDGFVRRQKELHPRILGGRSSEDVLLDLHVAKRSGNTLRPTIAGLMAMGSFPQKFFPRLNVTFTAFPGVDKATPAGSSKRFLDAQTVIGPIPYMIEDVLGAVTKNMRTGAVIEGAFRKDVPDYPRVAVREAVANALMHRDYSPEARGSQVQVNMYADRLEVLNPGGLYGDVTIDTLGVSGVSSSRNQFLSNILETTPYPEGGYVVENRGTGYQEIEEQLERAMMTPPKPKNSTVNFSLTFDKRRILPKEYGGAATGVDKAILAYLDKHSSASTADLVKESGMARSTISAHVKKLIGEGRIEPTEPMRSPKQRYRLCKD
ncbi:MAG: ATP-binding protein [Eggerthellaceae bacterium]|nr:ATP-binding protein [Eggerthellaceae bacterium]